MTDRPKWRNDVRIQQDLKLPNLLITVGIFLLLIGVMLFATGALPVAVLALFIALSLAGFAWTFVAVRQARRKYDALAASSPDDLSSYQAVNWTKDPRISKEIRQYRFLSYSSLAISSAYLIAVITGHRLSGNWWMLTSVAFLIISLLSILALRRARGAYEALPKETAAIDDKATA